MSRASSQMRELAGLLIAGESSEQKQSPDFPRPPAFLVCEKLGPQLAMLMGRGGYGALLSRALAVARTDEAWLRKVLLAEPGRLDIPDEELKKVGSLEVAAGSTALVAELLGLLVAFIGENLTLRLVRDVWPALSLDSHNSLRGNHP